MLFRSKFCDIDEIIIAYDKECEGVGDDNFKRNVTALQRLASRLYIFFRVSVMFDRGKENPKLEYKDAPIDQGREVFEQLYQDRIFL